MFLGRRSGQRRPYLEWRVRLFAVGALLSVVGLYLRSRPIIWLAIAVLVAGFFIRFLPRGGEGDGIEEGEEDRIENNEDERAGDGRRD